MHQTPSQIETERALIGCCLYDPERSLRRCMLDAVSEEWFCDPLHKAAWGAILALYRAGTLPDSTLVNAALDRQKVLIKDRAYLAASMDFGLPSALPHYIATLRHSRNCRLMQTELAFVSSGLPGCGPEQFREAQGRLLNLLSELSGIHSGESKTLGQIARDLIASWRLPPSSRGMIQWCLPCLQDTLGLISNEYICLAAQESVGKTAFALQQAAWLAQSGILVAIKSMESGRQELVERLVSLLGNVNTWNMRRGHGRSDEFTASEATISPLESLPLSISEGVSTCDQILAWALNEKAMGAKLLIIDNMKHIAPAQKYHSLPEMFRDFSLRIKWIRDQVKLPLILLHHLSKDEDVSWSRDLRRDVDLLLFLKPITDRGVQPTAQNDWQGIWYVNLEVVKNRNGKAGMEIPIEFLKSFQRFRDDPKTDKP